MGKAVYSSKTKAATIPPIAATATTLPTTIPIIAGIESPPENKRKSSKPEMVTCLDHTMWPSFITETYLKRYIFPSYFAHKCASRPP